MEAAIFLVACFVALGILVLNGSNNDQAVVADQPALAAAPVDRVSIGGQDYVIHTQPTPREGRDDDWYIRVRSTDGRVMGVFYSKQGTRFICTYGPNGYTEMTPRNRHYDALTELGNHLASAMA